MNRWVRGAVGAALPLVVCLAIDSNIAKAQTSANANGVIFSDAFETDTNGWTAVGPHGKVDMTTDSAHIKNGKGALQFAYTVGDKSGEQPAEKPAGLPFAILMRPTPDGQLEKMQALSFWARSDSAAPFAIALSEKGGGRYVTIFWLPKDQWQRVLLMPEDFWLSDGKDDPKDPDGKLDLDQVENITIVNVWSFLALGAGDSPESVAMFAHIMGAHTLWLDDFTTYAAPQPVEAPAPTAPDADKVKSVWIDDLRRDTLRWLALGDLQLGIDRDSPLHSRSLRADYTQGGGLYVALIHDMHRVDLAQKDRLVFDVASTKSAKLVVQLEEKGGAKYNAIIDVPGDAAPTRKSISFSEFTIADDSPKDPDGQLDLDQIKTLTIVDVTSAFGLDKQKNSLWIGPIRAVALHL